MAGWSQTLGTAAPTLSVGTLTGLALGYLLGRAHATWFRTRQDYITMSKRATSLRAAKWTAWWTLTRWVGLVAAVLVLLVVVPMRN
jgi:hypothetical protein